MASQPAWGKMEAHKGQGVDLEPRGRGITFRRDSGLAPWESTGEGRAPGSQGICNDPQPQPQEAVNEVLLDTATPVRVHAV